MRKCKQCKSKFNPSKPMQSVCSPKCAIALVRAGEAAQMRVRAVRREKLEYRAAHTTIGEATKKAQAAFNRFIRERDRGKPCISCGATPAQKYGGTMDAGHYRSVGACPQLRFCEWQVHAQCVRCNRDLSGNTVEYRKALVERYGTDMVEWLEGPHPLQHWRVDDLKKIAEEFRRRTRNLVRKRES